MNEISINNNQVIYDKYIHEYNDYSLYPPERETIIQFKDHWHKFRMLDIGVGTGRTTMTFSAIVKEYIGIDYSLPMVNKCKAIVGENESTRLMHKDARNLSEFYDNKFDFVLFSLNGIDNVSHEDRHKILSEVRKVVKTNGHFMFSTHSIYTFPYETKPIRFDYNNIARSLYRNWKSIKFNYRLNRLYKYTDPDDIRGKPWAILISGDHDFELPTYLINPEYQVTQLMENGFVVDQVINQKGQTIDPQQYKIGGFLYYLCSPV